ncbi:MAG: hypothetical protein IJP45_01385 [Paludibacteraceae bacterium]|nr:hypothetical protein [Paludibacteraceae bacterium]
MSGQSYCPETSNKGNGGKNAAEGDIAHVWSMLLSDPPILADTEIFRYNYLPSLYASIVPAIYP